MTCRVPKNEGCGVSTFASTDFGRIFQSTYGRSASSNYFAFFDLWWLLQPELLSLSSIFFFGGGSRVMEFLKSKYVIAEHLSHFLVWCIYSNLIKQKADNTTLRDLPSSFGFSTKTPWVLLPRFCYFCTTSHDPQKKQKTSTPSNN